MSRPVILFTGQWTDLPLEELAQKAAEWGYQGLELACWGDHFEVQRARRGPGPPRLGRPADGSDRGGRAAAAWPS